MKSTSAQICHKVGIYLNATNWPLEAAVELCELKKKHIYSVEICVDLNWGWKFCSTYPGSTYVGNVQN